MQNRCFLYRFRWQTAAEEALKGHPLYFDCDRHNSVQVVVVKCQTSKFISKQKPSRLSSADQCRQWV